MTPVPAVVRAATVLTFVWAGLMVVATLLFALIAALIGSEVLSVVDQHDSRRIGLAVLSSVIGTLAFSVLITVLAWHLGRRRAWARLALGSCCLVAMVGAVLALSPPTLVVLALAATVLVLLCLPATTAWLRGSGA